MSNKLTKAQIAKIVSAPDTKGAEGYMSKSQKVIALGKAGYDVGEIYQILKNVLPRYQMAYNVWSDYCRKNGVEYSAKDRGPSKKSQIIELLKEGKTPVEVSKELQCNYNMVIKYRKELEQAAWAAEKQRKEA